MISRNKYISFIEEINASVDDVPDTIEYFIGHTAFGNSGNIDNGYGYYEI